MRITLSKWFFRVGKRSSFGIRSPYVAQSGFCASATSNTKFTNSAQLMNELKVIQKQLNVVHKNSKKSKWKYVFGVLYLTPILMIYGLLFSFWRNIKNETLQQKNALKVINIVISGIHSSNNLDLTYLLNENTSSISFSKLKECIEYASNDDNVLGISLIFDNNTDIGYAQTQELRKELNRFKIKNKNKFITCYGKSVDMKEYILSTVCDEFYLMDSAVLNIYGFSFPQLFFKNALKKCGIKPFVLKREKYKNFADIFTEEEMSKEHKHSLMSLGNDLYCQFLNILQIDTHIIDGAPYTANEAIHKGLIDDTLQWNQYQMRLSQLSYNLCDESKDILFLSPKEYLKYNKKSNNNNNNEIALINISGEIRNGESEGINSGSDTICELIRSASCSDNVSAILLRIDTPGGDAIASESIWNALYDAKSNGNKAIVVSMGDMCASGGYLIASAADKIYALPATITGSIGVLLMSMSINELLTDKLNINYDDSIKFGRNSDIMSPFKYPSFRIQQRYETMIDNLYNIFMKRVSIGRNISMDKVKEIAQGKVYTGQQALQIGLIDELGGLREAQKAAEELSGLTEKGETAYLVKYSTKMERFIDILDGFTQTASTPIIVSQFHSLLKLKLWLNYIQTKLNHFQTMSYEPKPYYLCII